MILTLALSALIATAPNPSCELSGSYIGNAISPVFQLKIGNRSDPTWTYSSSDDMFGTLKPARVTEYRGTYEFDGDLAVFTGQLTGDKTRQVRFGLNFGHPAGKVAFNAFFPNARGEFTYHRKWFRRDGDQWQPAEERRLTLTLPVGDAPETWEVAWKGERILWDAEGKKTVEPVDVRLRYKRQAGWYELDEKAERKWEWLTNSFRLERDKGKVVSIHWANPYVGDLRGFHPGYADR